MADWKPFPRAGHPAFDAERLKAHWPHLHRGDAEPWPDDPLVVQAWVLLETVPVGYEIWRQLNNFPPELTATESSGSAN